MVEKRAAEQLMAHLNEYSGMVDIRAKATHDALQKLWEELEINKMKGGTVHQLIRDLALNVRLLERGMTDIEWPTALIEGELHPEIILEIIRLKNESTRDRIEKEQRSIEGLSD